MGRDADDEMEAEPTDMMPDTSSSTPIIEEQSERMKKYKSKIIV